MNTKQNEKRLKHITIERRPDSPVVVQRSVGPLVFIFQGPGPWDIPENHLRFVSDSFVKVKKKSVSREAITGQTGKPDENKPEPPGQKEEKKGGNQS